MVSPRYQLLGNCATEEWTGTSICPKLVGFLCVYFSMHLHLLDVVRHLLDVVRHCESVYCRVPACVCLEERRMGKASSTDLTVM